LFEETEGKRPLGKCNCRCEDNIKNYLKEREWNGVDWICLAEDRDQWQGLVNVVMYFMFHKMQRIC
jgi:hypothetical protein